MQSSHPHEHHAHKHSSHLPVADALTYMTEYGQVHSSLVISHALLTSRACLLTHIETFAYHTVVVDIALSLKISLTADSTFSAPCLHLGAHA